MNLLNESDLRAQHVKDFEVITMSSITDRNNQNTIFCEW